jgi:hypothetical protein
VVLEIKGSLATADTRWTFFQAPLLVEDALGFKFPVPSEYDYELLNAIIKHRFLEGPGSLEIKAGNYELFNTKNSKQVTSAAARASRNQHHDGYSGQQAGALRRHVSDAKMQIK